MFQGQQDQLAVAVDSGDVVSSRSLAATRGNAGVSNAGEAIFDRVRLVVRPAARRPRARLTSALRRRRRLHPPALRADAARQPPAATVGQRVNVQCDRRAEPQREIRVVRHRVLGQRVDEDIEPVAVHHQVGHHLRELVGLENDQHVGARVRPARRVAEGLDLDLALRPERRAHPFGNGAGAGRIVVDVGVMAQVMTDFAVFSVIGLPSLLADDGVQQLCTALPGPIIAT